MKDELLLKAKLSRVATFETSKELNCKFNTEKVWIRHKNGQIGIAYYFDLPQSEIKIVCNAPSFEEILDAIPKHINKIHLFGSSILLSDHLAEESAKIYLGLKKEGLL